ncbi:MAG: hypothetical protein QX195_00380 [Methylococcaceae bacterium]
MKKMISPFLLGLMLALSSATVLADSSPTQQNNVGGADLSSVLRSYDNHDVQFLALADGKGKQIDNRSNDCNNLCGQREGSQDCYRRCMMR